MSSEKNTWWVHLQRGGGGVLFRAVGCEEHIKNYKKGNEVHYRVLVIIKTYCPRLKTVMDFGRCNLRPKFLWPSKCLMNSSKQIPISRRGTEQAKFMPRMTNLINDFGIWALCCLIFPAVHVYINLPPPCFLFLLSSAKALKENLDCSVTSAAQWINPCNVTKPFSLLLTRPSLP